jgi:hypothetical protein
MLRSGFNFAAAAIAATHQENSNSELQQMALFPLN